jgi:hypothetical protein
MTRLQQPKHMSRLHDISYISLIQGRVTGMLWPSKSFFFVYSSVGSTEIKACRQKETEINVGERELAREACGLRGAAGE